MQIPFGSREPTESEISLLTKLGFTLNKMEKIGKYFYLELPSDSKVQCKVTKPAFDRSVITVSYNEMEVISISQKTAIYDSYVQFYIDEEAVNEALAKSSSMELKEEVKKPKLTEFQQKLVDALSGVEFIVFEDGAQRGYGKLLGVRLGILRELKIENKEEHDKLIDSNEQYKKLLSMFPDWTDINKLQPEYEAKDVGIFAAMAGSMGQHGEGLEDFKECRIM